MGTPRKNGQNETDNTEENRSKKGRKQGLSPGGGTGQTSGMDVSEEGHGEADKEVIRTLAFDEQVVLGECVDTGEVGGGSQEGRMDCGGVGAQ